MADLESLYREHLGEMDAATQKALEISGHDELVIAAGTERLNFDDDHGPAFHPAPHFAHRVAEVGTPNHLLHIRPGKRPKLLHHFPEQDFWAEPIPAANELGNHFDIEEYPTPEAIWAALAVRGRVAYLGPVDDHVQTRSELDINPASLKAELDWQRRFKTNYEIECMRRAIELAAKGHRAALEAFLAGRSELEILHDYLDSIGSTEADAPYDPIVALDDKSAWLHRRTKRPQFEYGKVLLLDAGARVRGYGSDITTTFVTSQAHPQYQELLRGLEVIQNQLCSMVIPGVEFTELHLFAHKQIAELLLNVGILKNCSPEAAVTNGYTTAFFPHGLGHLLGIQTHDKGGKQANPAGDIISPPTENAHLYGWLRKLNSVAAREVLTIEPGIYFLPKNLAPFRTGDHAQFFNWNLIDELMGFGMRLESDVLVTADGSRDMVAELLGRRTNVKMIIGGRSRT